MRKPALSKERHPRQALPADKAPEASPSEAQIEVNGLSFSYDGKVNALNNVSFKIKPGTFVSLIGHNGSGKSTLAKLLVGLLEPAPGTVKLFGLESNKKNIPAIRRRVGIVFQNPDNQFIATTVRDDIAFGLENRRVPSGEMDGIIARSAEAVGMLDSLDKEPQNLSGGQKQRVAVASVLALSPAVLILDEATAMLDPRGKREVEEAIAALRKADPSLTLISITHDLEDAFRSDRIIVLNKGEVVLDGKPAELMKKADELRAMHLGAPFIKNFADELRKQGVLDPRTLTIEGIAEELCR